MPRRKRTGRVKMLLVVEMEVSEKNLPHGHWILPRALDHFREATQPSNEYGLTLYAATREDLAPFMDSVLTREPPYCIVQQVSNPSSKKGD